jgi:hypothetical protein
MTAGFAGGMDCKPLQAVFIVVVEKKRSNNGTFF